MDRYEYQKKYYEDHKEERKEYHRKYYEMTKRMMLRYHPDRWSAISAKRREAGKAAKARKRKLIAESQKIIREARIARGWRQKDLAEKIGVTQPSIYHYEVGDVSAPWEKLIAVMPELKELRRDVQMF